MSPRVICISLTVAVLFFTASMNVCARSEVSPTTIKQERAPVYATDIMEGDSVAALTLIWPRWGAFQQTGQINTSFTQFGEFGFLGAFDAALDPTTGFETPSFSGIEYLFAGALWIGGVVGTDTLVSTGFDGWSCDGKEFGSVQDYAPSTSKAWYPSDYSARAGFYDTLSFVDERCGLHTPLNIDVSLRSHVWRTDPLKYAVFYDMVLTNIGEQQIESAYIGFHMDGDVCHQSVVEGYADDIAGFIRDSGIAYIIDNDGDPVEGLFPDDLSPSRAFAFEMLASSFVPTDTNLNWWISNADPSKDFGPRMKGTPEDPFRDFGTGGLGTPEGDPNKYYVLSHKEWDYDQVFTSSITEDDPIWCYPDQSLVDDFADGFDTRFLYSMGPLSLLPGESHRLVFTTFTAESVHTDAANYSNLPGSPQDYLDGLGLEEIEANGSAAKEVLSTILDPLKPPMGLEVSGDMASWDPWVFDDVLGYEVYVTEVDISTFPFPGAIPPWYIPESPNHVASVGTVTSTSVSGLIGSGPTAVNVAHNSTSGTGDLSGSLFLNIPAPGMPVLPEWTLAYHLYPYFVGWAVLRWQYIEGVDHYNVYKAADLEELNQSVTAPYYCDGAAIPYHTKDSIQVDGTWWYYNASDDPYATVPGEDSVYVDHTPNDSCYYVVAAVAANGLETHSAPTQLFLVPERTRDVLVITNSGLNTGLSLTPADTIIAFYDYLLLGLDFDIFSVLDSIQAEVCGWTDECPGMTNLMAYKLVIIDDIDTDRLMTPELIEQLEKYVYSGGRVAYCGSFCALNYMYYHPSNPAPGWCPLTLTALPFSNYIDSVFFVYPWCYWDHWVNPDPVEDSTLFGFHLAEGSGIGFPDVECDTARYPLDADKWAEYSQPNDQPPSISAFKPKQGAIVTHYYRSLYPSTSLVEGDPVGIRFPWLNGQVDVYGFHLYYMKYDDARNLIMSLLGSNTATGSDVDVPLGSGVTVTFESVTGDGSTSLGVGSIGPDTPEGFCTTPEDPPTYYEITTTADFAGSIEVCITYDEAAAPDDESTMQLLHYEGGEWLDITGTHDMEANVICGITTSLSPFVVAQQVSTGVNDDEDGLPKEYSLSQNYPNPFNPVTEIEFALPRASDVKLEVFNIIGQRVTTLANRHMEAGYHTVPWDGSRNASGIYLYRLTAGDFVQSKKMMLLK